MANIKYAAAAPSKNFFSSIFIGYSFSSLCFPAVSPCQGINRGNAQQHQKITTVFPIWFTVFCSYTQEKKATVNHTEAYTGYLKQNKQ